MSKDTGGPAFPIRLNPGERYEGHVITDGMTLRDYFAAKVMQAILSGPEWQILEMKSIAANGDGDVDGVIAHFAYKMADTMLIERGKNE